MIYSLRKTAGPILSSIGLDPEGSIGAPGKGFTGDPAGEGPHHPVREVPQNCHETCSKNLFVGMGNKPVAFLPDRLPNPSDSRGNPSLLLSIVK